MQSHSASAPPLGKPSSKDENTGDETQRQEAKAEAANASSTVQTVFNTEASSGSAILAQFSNQPKKDETLYEILGVATNAGDAEIKTAYRKKMLRHHTDRGGDKEMAQKINKAYAVLSDPDKRKSYDKMLAGEVLEVNDFDISAPIINFVKADLKKREQAENGRKSSVTLTSLPPHFHEHEARQYQRVKKGYKLFAIGMPIRISDGPLRLRKTIPDHELLSAAFSSQKVRLFGDEFRAKQYSHASQRGNFCEDQACFQAPIIEVEMLVDMPADVVVQHVDMYIDSRYKGLGAIGYSKASFVELDKSCVEPIKLTLHAQTATENKSYPSISFTENKSNSATKGFVRNNFFAFALTGAAAAVGACVYSSMRNSV